MRRFGRGSIFAVEGATLKTASAVFAAKIIPRMLSRIIKDDVPVPTAIPDAEAGMHALAARR